MTKRAYKHVEKEFGAGRFLHSESTCSVENNLGNRRRQEEVSKSKNESKFHPQ